MTPADLPAIGQQWTLTAADCLLAASVGFAQHSRSGPRGNHDHASLWQTQASVDFRIVGAAGEIAVARMLGLDPQVVVADGPVGDPDIVTPGGTQIDVKCGRPMVGTHRIVPAWWYVVVSRSGRKFTVTNIASGLNIVRLREYPPAEWCPRPGTRTMNFVIP